MKRKWTIAMLATAAAAFALPAMAQDEPAPQPVAVERPLASPRLAIARNPGLPVPAMDAADTAAAVACCRVMGAAYNFPRRDARIVIRQGTAVDFTIPDIEGVIYDKACGWLAVFIRFDVQGPDGQWRYLDMYFRHVRLCGPTRAHAEDVSVKYLEPRPGEYLVRAMIYTYAIPTRGDLSLDRTQYPCMDLARDTVYTKIRVVESPTPDDLLWEAAEPVEPVDAQILDLE